MARPEQRKARKDYPSAGIKAGDTYCFCSTNRVGDDSKMHEPECRDLRAALAAMKEE